MRKFDLFDSGMFQPWESDCACPDCVARMIADALNASGPVVVHGKLPPSDLVELRFRAKQERTATPDLSDPPGFDREWWSEATNRK